METEQLCLANFPSRGIMGVVDGLRPMYAGPGPAYICCQQPSEKVIVRNTTVRLIDVYKLSARKRPSSTAAAGGSGTKRPAGTADQDDRAAKRQQQQQPVKGLTSAAASSLLPTKQQQQQQPALAGAKASTLPNHQQQQQQQRGAVPLATVPNGSSAPAPTAAAVADEGACSASKQLLQYTPEQMMLFSNKKLAELLKGCGLKVAGKKDDMVRRLMDYQRRVRKAAQGSTTAAVAAAAAAAGRAARV